MSNVTLSIPDDVLKQAREYARRNKTSINAIIRDFLSKTFTKKKKSNFQEFFAIADKYKTSSGGKKITRDEIYEL